MDSETGLASEDPAVGIPQDRRLEEELISDKEEVNDDSQMESSTTKDLRVILEKMVSFEELFPTTFLVVDGESCP